MMSCQEQIAKAQNAVTVFIMESTCTCLPEKAQHRFHLVSSNRVTNESYCFPSHQFQKLLGIESWEVTLGRFPPPILIFLVRPSISLAILHLCQDRACVVCV